MRDNKSILCATMPLHCKLLLRDRLKNQFLYSQTIVWCFSFKAQSICSACKLNFYRSRNSPFPDSVGHLDGAYCHKILIAIILITCAAHGQQERPSLEVDRYQVNCELVTTTLRFLQGQNIFERLFITNVNLHSTKKALHKDCCARALGRFGTSNSRNYDGAIVILSNNSGILHVGNGRMMHRVAYNFTRIISRT